MKKLMLLLLGTCLLLFANTAEKKDMLIISTNMGNLPQEAKVHAFMEAAKGENLRVDFLFESQIKKEEYLLKLNGYKIVMFDSLAGAGSIRALLSQFSDALEKSSKDLVVLPISIVSETPYRKNITQEQNKELNDYWHNGGEKNFINFAKYINMHVLKKAHETIEAVSVIPEEGIYHPKNPNIVFNTLQEYQTFLGVDILKNEAKRPVIALGMHRNAISSNSLSHIKWAIEYLEKKGAITIPYFTEVSGNDFIGEKFLTFEGKTLVDVLLNFQIMIIDHESLKPKYEKLNIPILHSLNFEGAQAEWEKSNSGTTTAMIPMSHIIPETIGYTDPMITAAQNPATKTLEPIVPQLKSLVNKALNMSKLKRAKNSEKKVAVMFYNYPHGINNMGASFMNIPQSLENLFASFVKEGYKTEQKSQEWFEKEAIKTLKAYYEQGHEDEMLKEKSALLYPLEKYEAYLKTLPDEVSKKMILEWGEASKSAMVVEQNGKKYFLVPAIEIDNVLLLPQPRRGDKQKNSKDSEGSLWHNTKIAVNHSYLATYLYVRENFNADAIIHFGTHGTQEWMPGKERGLSIYDDPFIVLGDVPIFYPYITNNVAEALQVKRRGRGTLISHQTPPFAISGTYNELSKIMELITQYKTVDEGAVRQNLKKNIIHEATVTNIHKDIEFTLEKIESDFVNFLSKLEDYILGTSAAAQPLGMHTFGTYPKEEHLITTVMQMVGKEFMKKADGENYSAKEYKDFNKSNSYMFIKKYAIDDADINEADAQFKPYLQKAKEYVNSFKNQEEIINLLRALKGEYIKTSTGGDSIRNPESLPTGRNMYGFDPNKVPTKAAYETGSKLMEEFIQNYYKENGEYPKKLTFNLWSLETMRHHGVVEAQILYAMGVKPIWNEQGFSDKFIQDMALPMLKNYLPDFLAKWVASMITLPRVEFVLDLLPNRFSKKPKKMIAHAKSANKGDIVDVEIIPYSELKRPRVDTVISITGLYRDTFPQAIKLLAKAVEKVAKLKEENNNVYINAQFIQQKLLEQNLSVEDATTLSTIRVFSNKTGYYGSGVNKIEKTENFTQDADEQIAKDYLKERGYYFGSDEGSWNKQIAGVDLYAKNLSKTDAVIFSRSSNLYGMLTSDDPYGYFGALSLAIRSIDKKNPKTYISNLRDVNNAKMQSSAEFMAQELRSRYFHPNWIEEMKAEGYSGTQNVLDVVNNFWGWQVVDPGVVRDDQWQEFFEVYVNDKYDMKLKEWFENSNPDNLAQIMQRMLEAARLGYWQTDEATIKELKERYKELEKKYNIKSYNEKFKELLESDKVGSFGLAFAKTTIANAQAKQQEEAKELQKGQKLEKQEVMKKEDDYALYFVLAMLFAVVLSGALYELRKIRNS
ncbi:MAG: cobaltochelatase subunit CobN [Sulfurimonas sp.]|uniref:cobaltochelatase subunit CobN n=1 Tax=Sulfurimonas sp. TaxID=2022749 RepID=UPI003D0E38CA